ncbi:hypothetical protein [Pseudooceanicola nitratireducens]|uniref:hypothetical protein n=1 Tax=Pseudooceanicola nitratireducens TaxID=517719 RepID=UPI001C96DD69|nr:hypothetical protein [Pseudooceanicola nitratireducens]MBY6157092.1 hypothetical protein [Pseudooceanicola nitratireducens]
MKPNFALILSMEGIALLQRAASGWALVGEAAPESADLAGEMATLRAMADRLDPAPTFKIVIPNDQIRYVSVPVGAPDPETRRQLVAQALDGQTPYALDELVTDSIVTGKMLQIAAVAIDTLQEADEFARGFGFQPVCFAAMPETRDYAGEPYFGTAHDVPADIHVEQDAVAIRVNGRVQMPEDAASADTAAAAAKADEGPVSFVSRRGRDDTPAKAAAASDAATPADPPLDPANADPGTDLRDAKDATRITLSPPETDFRTPTQIEDAPKGPGLAARISGSLAGVTGALAGLRARRAARKEPAIENPVFAAQDALRDTVDAPSGPEVSPAPAPAKVPATETVEQTPDAPEPAAKKPAKSRRKGKARDPAPAKDATPPAVEDPESTVPVSIAPEGIPADAPRVVGSLTAEERKKEAERLTVFGARNGASYDTDTGKPAMAAAIVLAVFLLGTAGWAAIFLNDDLAPFFGASDEAAETEEAIAAAPATDSQGQDQREDQAVTAPEPLSTGEATGDDAVSPLIVTEAVEEAESQENAAETAVPGPEAAEQAETATDGDGQELPAQDPATDPSIDPGAEARYAATGIWQQSPDQLDSDAPGAQASPDAGDDPSAVADNAGLESAPRQVPQLSLSTLEPDALPAPPGPPATQGRRYVMDDRGLVIATPEGAETPAGILVFTGAPPLTPPTRPGTQDDAALRPAPAETPADSATNNPATDVANAGDPAPSTTVADATEETPAATGTSDTAAEEVAEEPQVVIAARPVKRPQPRPFAEPDAVQQAVAEATADTGLAPAASLASAAIQPNTGSALIEDAVRASLSAGLASGAATAADEAITEDDGEPELEPTFTALRPLNRPSNIQEIAAAARTTPVAPPSVEPNVPSSASVTRQATLRNAINLNRINLIGVYGQPSDRRALVRLSNGRYRKVKVGDRIDGGRVLAIGDASLRYQKNGRNLTLDMPKG